MDQQNIDQKIIALAELASEFWKLLRNYDRVIDAAPEKLRSGIAAQAKFSSRRLDLILDGTGLRIESFDGQIYSPNLPVIPINADDFSDAVSLVIKQTLEPAVIYGTINIKVGRVFLGEA